MWKKLAFLMVLVAVVCNDNQGITGMQEDSASEKDYVTLDNGNILSPNGTEYKHFANEGFICTFGSTTFLGKVKGEKSSSFYKNLNIKEGIYSCEKDTELNILKRIIPNNEWASYYRKVTLAELDLSPENCTRFEFIRYGEINSSVNFSPNIKHMTCNKGITKSEKISAFLTDVKSQKSPNEAGLNKIKSENSYVNYEYGIVYGYFENEFNLAIPFRVQSYHGKEYSIEIMGKEYVLPKKWLTILKHGKE